MGYFQIAVSEILGTHYSSAICECYEKLLLLVSRTRFEKIIECVENDDETFERADLFQSPVPKSFINTLEKLQNEHGLTRKRILLDVIEILRSTTRGDERRIIKTVPPGYLENVLKLYSQDDKASFDGLVKGIVENKEVYYFLTSLLIKLVLSNIFDKHINLGDTYDRGELYIR